MSDQPPGRLGPDDERARRLLARIRDVPDFPKPGVVFKDISPLLADHTTFTEVVDALASGACTLAIAGLGVPDQVRDAGGPELVAFVPREGTIGSLEVPSIGLVIDGIFSKVSLVKPQDTTKVQRKIRTGIARITLNGEEIALPTKPGQVVELGDQGFLKYRVVDRNNWTGTEVRAFQLTLPDLLGGSTHRWQGRHNYVRLDPKGTVAHVFAVRAVAERDPR